MNAVENDEDWSLKAVTSGKTVKTVKARELFREIAEAAWECADPGMQFDTTINRWHTTPNAGRIEASNPCSEYMHLNNSACNLSSINLLKFLNEDASFDIAAYKHTVEIMFTAQEILVGYSEYPTKNITKTARAYRELGLGYANLGALLMAQGLPYDSDEGRAQAAAMTALMTGHAYSTSAKIASRVGPFAGYQKDSEAMNHVLKMHRDEVDKIDPSMVSEELLSAAASAWDEAVELSELYGVRNSQATLLAPTGTIAFFMDCDTTGIEPDLGLVKLKKLVGGGTMTIVNQTVPRALKALGYNRAQIEDIVNYIDIEKSIIGAPHLKNEHLPVFACSMGDNAIHYAGHVKMMGAVQPFLSGAISKTVNMPEDATIEDVEQLHMEAWKMGIKAIAIYRDNAKVGQPLAMAKKEGLEEKTPDLAAHTAETPQQVVSAAIESMVPRGAIRRELPKVRSSKTFSFKVADSRGFFTVGEYDDGTPGELFISVSKMGSTLRGLMDAFAISISYGLQYGVPLKSYVRVFSHMSFAPSGITDDSEIRTASSIVDYIFKRLGKTYLSFDDQLELGMAALDDMPQGQTSLLENQTAVNEPTQVEVVQQMTDNLAGEPAVIAAASTEPSEQISQKIESDQNAVAQDQSAPLCANCGNQTQRAGTCYVCTAC
ncbi:MAG TPA: vitamin B12-dependent ribonucleotide reductase, partial [Nitrososphaera sp.]|nr:vitamin B12-dependent ribonucleotide reductase [Nitrososphaera sp.]